MESKFAAGWRLAMIQSVTEKLMDQEYLRTCYPAMPAIPAVCIEDGTTHLFLFRWDEQYMKYESGVGVSTESWYWYGKPWNSAMRYRPGSQMDNRCSCALGASCTNSGET